jgi:hypothetical protein
MEWHVLPNKGAWNLKDLNWVGKIENKNYEALSYFNFVKVFFLQAGITHDTSVSFPHQ